MFCRSVGGDVSTVCSQWSPHAGGGLYTLPVACQDRPQNNRPKNTTKQLRPANRVSPNSGVWRPCECVSEVCDCVCCADVCSDVRVCANQREHNAAYLSCTSECEVVWVAVHVCVCVCVCVDGLREFVLAVWTVGAWARVGRDRRGRIQRRVACSKKRGRRVHEGPRQRNNTQDARFYLL